MVVNYIFIVIFPFLFLILKYTSAEYYMKRWRRKRKKEEHKRAIKERDEMRSYHFGPGVHEYYVELLCNLGKKKK